MLTNIDIGLKRTKTYRSSIILFNKPQQLQWHIQYLNAFKISSSLTFKKNTHTHKFLNKYIKWIRRMLKSLGMNCCIKVLWVHLVRGGNKMGMRQVGHSRMPPCQVFWLPYAITYPAKARRDGFTEGRIPYPICRDLFLFILFFYIIT